MDEHRYGEIALGKPNRDHRQMLTNSLLVFRISGLVAVNLNSTTISKKMEMMSCFFVTKTHTLIATSVYTLRMFVLSRRRLLSCRAKTDLPKYQREEEVTKFHCKQKKTDSTHPHRIVNFRNYLVKITTCLAFTGVIVPSFRALAASEDVKKWTPAQLSIAAAANLEFALDDLIKEFQEKYPAAKVNVNYGVSEHFFAQLESGAPYDLFLSADMGYPRKLAEAGSGADNVFSFFVNGSEICARDSTLRAQRKLPTTTVLNKPRLVCFTT